MKLRRSQPAVQEPADDLSDYRRHLQTAEQKSQEDFDKTVLSLSGGALGISFVFLKDVIGPNPVVHPDLLFAAWVAWGTSTFCVLASYYASHLALRRAIRQIDEGTIRNQKPGGFFRNVTAVLNAAGAVLFLVGVFAIVFFANANLKTKVEPSAKSKSPAASSSAPAASSASSTSAPASAPAKRPPNI